MSVHSTAQSTTAPRPAPGARSLGPSRNVGLFATAVYVAVCLWTYLAHGA